MDNIKNLSDVFGYVKETDAYYKVYAKATYYPNFTRVFVPDRPYDKLIPFMEPVNKIKTINGKPFSVVEESFDRSLRRTKKRLTDYVLCNQFELFATFTFDGLKIDRYDIDKCKNSMSGWFKNQQKRKGKFEYTVVPELHKDGALHFHALLKNYPGRLKESTSSNTGKLLKQKGRQLFDIPSYRLGFTNVKKIDDSSEDQTKVGFYLLKYIKKDMPLFPGKKKYWVSNGLILPKTEDNPGEWYKKFQPIREYKIEFGVIYDFPITAKGSE